ncbi:MAG: flagellar basal body L-ring protein FlgH [Gammaproteobacteria bacterium]
MNSKISNSTTCKLMIVASILLLLSACAKPIALRNPAYSPLSPKIIHFEDSSDGAIFQNGMRVGFFDSMRAKNVGDILTITLKETTNASKSARTETTKGAIINEVAPTIIGSDVTHNGKNILENTVDSDRRFSSQGQSAQSNNMTGELTVTVVRVFSNRNLLVRGEKLIMLNQGNEYLRVMGIVRPEDIDTNNTVLSTRVANAQISYGGQGVINDANKMGWLSKFFQGNAWPF